MQHLALVRSAALVFALISPILVHAQFQEPTKEELQMTADPKAPGAAAVYLNYTEIADDPLHYQSVYARIKVLQEKGKELATVEVPYWWGSRKIHDVKGRTIHPDGSISTLAVKPEDLLWVTKGDQQIHRKVFTLPNVEVGSILEYYYQEDYDDNHYSSPEWELQKPYFVHQAHYAFTPFKGFLKGSQNATNHYLIDEKGNVVNSLIWWNLLPQGVQVKQDALGRFSLDLTDISPVPDEDWMPPMRSFLYAVRFYYKSAYNSADFWETEAKRWSKEVDHFAEPTAAIRQAVAGIVAPGDSDLDKAKKLYKAVQALDNTDFSREKSKTELKTLGLKAAKRAEDTWAQKSGSRQDIALLYLAMLRAAGLTAYDMKVVNRDRGVLTPGYLYFEQLDDDVIVLTIGGKEVLLDPGEKMCPFQTVHWKHSGAGGVRQSAQGRAVSSSPTQTYTDNVLVRIADINVDGHGMLTGAIRFIMRGQEALYWRQQALLNDEDEVKKKFDKMLERVTPDGVVAHIDHFLALDDPDSNLMAYAKVQGAIGTATAKRLLLPGFFFEARGHSPFVNKAQRLAPIDMQYAERVNDQVTYRVPAALTIEGVPPDNKLIFPDQAILIIKTASKPGEVTVSRSLARAFTMLKPEEYKDLRSFYEKVAQNDQQQVVLLQAAEQKGN